MELCGINSDIGWYIIRKGSIRGRWVYIIDKDRVTMSAGFRLVEVGILSGWSILLKE